MRKLSDSYTKYFNIKNSRVGPMLQGNFKSVHIEDNEQLLHVSRYIHLNPLVSHATLDLNKYRWSSYPGYVGIVKDGICATGIVLSQFKSKINYQEFVLDQVNYVQELERIKHLALDFEE